jgi:hypothetical protein
MASSRIDWLRNVEEYDDIVSTLDFKAVEYSHIMTTHYFNDSPSSGRSHYWSDYDTNCQI